MKLLTRTTIVLIVVNLLIGNSAQSQKTPEQRPIQPTVRSESAPPLSSALEPSATRPAQVPEPVPVPGSVPPPMPVPPRMFTISGRTGLSGVEMTGLPGNPVTGRNGYYSAEVEYGWSGAVKPKKDGFNFEPAELRYSRVISDLTNNDYRPTRIGPAPTFARTGSREVLVIPSADIKAEDLTAITEDLQVMSQIFDEKFKEPQEIQGVFVDFGDFFGRDSRSTEAIYMQGYGVLFLMEVNFAFSPEPKVQEKKAEETEDADPIWQRTRQKIFSPPGFGGDKLVPEEKYSADKIDQLKTELIRTLKHAANIRNIQPDEWVILTVIGKARQSGGMYEYNFSRSRTPRTRSSRGRSSSSSRGDIF